MIALIITVIVLLILAGVSLNALVGENGIISNAQMASVKTKFASYKEELGMSALDDTGIYASGNKLKDYIKNIKDEDIDKFVIIKSKLVYIGSDKLEASAAEGLGLGGGSSASAVKEIQAIVDGVIELGDTNEVPASDTVETIEVTNTADGLIGTRLYDRNSTNIFNGKWNIVDEYNSQNVKTERYEGGYYLLERGKTYTINGESLKFENDYVINYKTKEFTVLSDRAVNWNKEKTLAVNGAVLNLDPSVFADGKWVNNLTNKTYTEELNVADTEEKLETVNKTFYNFYNKSIEIENGVEKEVWNDTKIQKTGDVVYDLTTNSLNFNQKSGEGGYLKLAKEGLDFSNGFTFEMYANLNRLEYNNGTKYSCLGLFCRIEDLVTVTPERSMRFGLYSSKNSVCRFGPGNKDLEQLYGTNGTFLDSASKAHVCSENLGYSKDENFYLTVVYNSLSDNSDLDAVDYYINGKLFFTCPYYKYVWNRGIEYWNKDECPFFIGVCPWQSTGNLYYLQGQVYTTRLYTKSLTAAQVKDNYETTLKYRSSF
ncbi:MAG: hypothetical protein IJ867_08575 [Clostridia bacterium]|nr:hypothetical protein [Clostridia bacterium]